MIEYTQQFKDKCKNAYPDYTLLHKLIDSGSARVGILLNEFSDGEDIEDEADLREVNSKISIQERIDLYGEWAEFTANWYEYNKEQEQKKVLIRNI